MTIWPLYILAACGGLYTLKCIVVYLWDESTRMSVNEYIRQNEQYRKETIEGKDNA